MTLGHHLLIILHSESCLNEGELVEVEEKKEGKGGSEFTMKCALVEGYVVWID